MVFSSCSSRSSFGTFRVIWPISLMSKVATRITLFGTFVVISSSVVCQARTDQGGRSYRSLAVLAENELKVSGRAAKSRASANCLLFLPLPPDAAGRECASRLLALFQRGRSSYLGGMRWRSSRRNPGFFLLLLPAARPFEQPLIFRVLER